MQRRLPDPRVAHLILALVVSRTTLLSSTMTGAMKRALSELLATARGRKRRAEDDDCDDEFVVRPKKIHSAPVNGQIGPCAGHEYEDEDRLSDSSEEEEVLSDPKGLFDTTDSEPELEEDVVSNEKPHFDCKFIDDEAEVSGDDEDEEDDDVQEADEYETVSEDGSHESESSGSSREIRSPLKMSDFRDDEAHESNNLFDMYDGLKGHVRHSDSESNDSADSTSGSSDESTIPDLMEDSSDSESDVCFMSKRRKVIESDSDENEPLTRPLQPNPTKRTDQSVEQVIVEREHAAEKGIRLVTYSLSDEEHKCILVSKKCQSKQKSHTSAARRRFLRMRYKIKPWIITSKSSH